MYLCPKQIKWFSFNLYKHLNDLFVEMKWIKLYCVWKKCSYVYQKVWNFEEWFF